MAAIRTAAIAAKISEPLFEFIEDYRWNQRIISRSEIVNEALEDWAARRGYTAPPVVRLESDEPNQR